MQTTNQLLGNPFALMMEPDAIFQAMESSERLERLQRRVCRPLDKPLIAHVNNAVGFNEYDLAIDAEPETDV